MSNKKDTPIKPQSWRPRQRRPGPHGPVQRPLVMLGWTLLVLTLWIYTGRDSTSNPFSQRSRSKKRTKYARPYQTCRPQNATERVLHTLEFVQQWHSSKPIVQSSITIATQLSVERLGGLALQCSVWGDRIAAVVYMPVHNGRLINLVQNNVTIAMRSNVTNVTVGAMTLKAAKAEVHALHTRLEAQNACALDVELVIERFVSLEDPYAVLYPFNALRNRALRLTQTDAIMLLDADFLPSAGLASQRLDTLQHADLFQQLEAKVAVVLPAFSVGDPESLSMVWIAEDVMQHYKKLAYAAAHMGKPFVVDCFRDGQLLMAASYYLPSQNPTDYVRWITANASYEVAYEPHYEPYVIVHRKYIPWYDERFRGYGNDKVQQLTQLAAFGVRLRVHPTEYAIHVPHRHAVTRWATFTSKIHHTRLVNLHNEVAAQIKDNAFVPVTSFANNRALCP